MPGRGIPGYKFPMSKNREQLAELFSRDVCTRATKPLRNGVQIAVTIGKEGPFNLHKDGDKMAVSAEAPASPDMTFHLPERALNELASVHTEDIGEVGVAILKLMAHGDPKMRMSAKVHIGAFTLLRNGYLGVLPLGGPGVMKFLASKGLTNIGKIKDALGRLKT